MMVDLPTRTKPSEVAEGRGGALLIVDFHRNGNSAAYRTVGWSGQELSFVWAVGGQSGLYLPTPVETTPLVVDIDFTICIVPDLLSAAVVRVFANGTLVGATRAHGRTRLRCNIPAALVRPGEPVALRLEHPNFVRLDRMERSGDDRPLAICVYSVSLYPPWLRPAAELLMPAPPGCELVEAAVPGGPESTPTGSFAYRFSGAEAYPVAEQDGWWRDDQGNLWAFARECALNLPAPNASGPWLAEITICPMFVRTVLETQRINILLDGAVIGQFRTGVDTTLGIPLPPELFEPGGTLNFAFAVPDGLPLHDFGADQPRGFLGFVLDSIVIAPVPPKHHALARLRDDDTTAPVPTAVSAKFLNEPLDRLTAAIKEELGIDVTDIIRHFDSLGDNCSFGLAQRKAGSEVLGLLRFANTPLPSLFRGLDDEFKAVADKSQIALRLHPAEPREWTLSVDRYGIRWHTGVYEGQSDEATIYAQQTMRLGYLRRKFYEGVSAGRKIMTVSRADPLKHPIPMPTADELDWWEEKPESLRLAEVLPLFLRLNERAPNTLLFLTRCLPGRRPGMVELLAPGIMRGYVDDFVISDKTDIRDHATWVRVVANAWLLDQGPNANFRERPIK